MDQSDGLNVQRLFKVDVASSVESDGSIFSILKLRKAIGPIKNKILSLIRWKNTWLHGLL